MIETKLYDLPDASLLDGSDRDRAIVIWVPDRLMVVVGNGSRINRELNLKEVRGNSVPVFRRPSGGCSVVLSPKMLAVSIAEYGRVRTKSSVLFNHFNEILIRALQGLGVEGLAQAGTSDIVVGDRKIVGSAIYRNRDMVFYHAILNLAEEPSTIQSVLAMPPRMPDYRKGRSHTRFVTSVAEAGWMLEPDQVRHAIETEWLKANKPAA